MAGSIVQTFSSEKDSHEPLSEGVDGLTDVSAGEERKTPFF